MFKARCGWDFANQKYWLLSPESVYTKDGKTWYNQYGEIMGDNFLAGVEVEFLNGPYAGQITTKQEAGKIAD